jgi:hypothetical protein
MSSLKSARRRLRHPFGGRISRLIRDLSGASSDAFRGYLLGALDATIDGSVLVRRLVAGEIGGVEASELMRGIEHRGDAERARLVTELRTALVTPIDREDLFRLSRAIDDILDNLRDFVREWTLFDMDRSVVLAPVAEVVADAVVDLRAAVEALVTDPRAISPRALSAKKSTNAIRRAFDAQMAALLVGDVTVRMLRERELLRRFDVVGLRLGSAADSLGDAAVKRADD